jgi:Zinc-binding dehydrogenase
MVVKTMQVKSDPKMLVEMVRAVQSGKLSIPIEKSFPLKEAGAAHAAAEAGSAGKILCLLESRSGLNRLVRVRKRRNTWRVNLKRS